jgi:hypothetical protein
VQVLMPYACGPKEGLQFTRRCADLCKKHAGVCTLPPTACPHLKGSPRGDRPGSSSAQVEVADAPSAWPGGCAQATGDPHWIWGVRWAALLSSSHGTTTR